MVVSCHEFLIRAAIDVDVPYEDLEIAEAEAIHQRISALYPINSTTTVSLYKPHAWTLVPYYVGIQNVLFAFSPLVDRHVVKFANGSLLSRVLNNFGGCEPWLFVNPSLTYMLEYTDHDLLTGYGEAFEWLKGLTIDSN